MQMADSVSHLDRFRSSIIPTRGYYLPFPSARWRQADMRGYGHPRRFLIFMGPEVRVERGIKWTFSQVNCRAAQKSDSSFKLKIIFYHNTLFLPGSLSLLTWLNKTSTLMFSNIVQFCYENCCNVACDSKVVNINIRSLRVGLKLCVGRPSLRERIIKSMVL